MIPSSETKALVYIIIYFFFYTRLYSLRNYPFDKLLDNYNIFFVFGKIFYSLFTILIIAYLIGCSLSGIVTGGIIVVIIGYVVGYVLTSGLSTSLRLPPSTKIPPEMMLINCIGATIFGVLFIIHIVSLF